MSRVPSKVYVCTSRRARAPTLVDQSIRERPRRLAFYRVRSARTALDRRRRRVQQLRVRGDRATKARDGRPGASRTIDEHDLGEPAPRRAESTKPREDANVHDAESHAGPVGGAAQRLGLGNVRSPLQYGSWRSFCYAWDKIGKSGIYSGGEFRKESREPKSVEGGRAAGALS